MWEISEGVTKLFDAMELVPPRDRVSGVQSVKTSGNSQYKLSSIS
jgi:hypothetical protein